MQGSGKARMSSSIFTELGWLPRPPLDFRTQCRTLASTQDTSCGEAIQFLASHALDNNQLTSLTRTIATLRKNGADCSPLKPLRLGLISNSTTALIGPTLIASAARHGILLELVQTDYAQAVQEALDPNSQLNRSQPDLVLVAINWRGLPLRSVIGDATSAENAVTEALATLAMIRDGIRQGCGAPVIFETVARPAESLFGSFDWHIAGTARDLADRFNRGLASRLLESSDFLLDVAGLAETVGLADWHDAAQWHLAKLPFAQRMVPLYADHVARLLSAVRGKSRRCLVLDLDNTVWGGVIGDDGVAGIVIGQGSAVGEAHLDIQSTALRLRARGIVLAVSSKNDNDIARLPFREHPDMLLREDHIAVFQANWLDKASNLRAIAEALSLGLDSLVLLDDNPVEREQVRQAAPQVAVPELPEDPALYSQVLLASGYFESVVFSDEDRVRADYYQANATRAVLLEKAGNLDEFLTSLEMTITFAPFDQLGLERIAQLIAKSNQFNLTSRRYTASQVAALAQDPDIFTLQVRLDDRFGDNGMICVIVCRKHQTVWEIDTWLMSCRVLGRRVEEAVLHQIASAARHAGADQVCGRYIRSERNAMVKDHYAKLGFSLRTEDEGGNTEWVLKLDELAPVEIPMRIRRRDASETAVAAI
jgi:FkbH-like protein